MKSRIIALFILIISLNTNSYCPLFLVQEHLNKASEKLIIKINSVSCKLVPDTDNYYRHLDFYNIELNAEVQFVANSGSGILEGDLISLHYKTSKYKPDASQILCGYQPMTIPKEQNLCITYLNHENGNYIFHKSGGSWSLQIINDDYKGLDLDDDVIPCWIKFGLHQITKKLENTTL
jgi:hypothetical protein